MAVIEKRAGLRIGDQDAYVNIAGGIRINEPSLDLATVLSVASSFRNRPFDPKTVVFGEVGLSGEVRAVNIYYVIMSALCPAVYDLYISRAARKMEEIRV